jgi:flagellar transcriptional activator FlhC
MAAISLERHRKLDLALALVERKLRTTPAHAMTGLPEAEIRSLYRMVHGRSPTSGSIPSTGHLLTSRRRQAKISVFVAVYLGLAGEEGSRSLDPRMLIRSHDLFRELIGERQAEEIDLTAAWSVLREYQGGISRRPCCKACGACYIISENADVPLSCPFCALRRRV